MVFNSFTFIAFAVLVYLLHSLPIPWTLRKFNLLTASYLFYASWDVRYVVLLLFATGLNWSAARYIAAHTDHPRARRVVLWGAITLSVGILAGFKYFGQLLLLWQSAAAHIGIPYAPPAATFLLPVGLSFFTFQSMSYTIDVYRRTIAPATSLLDFALFVAFFPGLLAGPLMRAGSFLPQCARPRRAPGREVGWGLCLFTLGLFLKVTLADHLLAPIVRKVFDAGVRPDALSAWTGTLAFAGQDYCDFAGYSTCAMGIALCLGFTLPANFRAPLASIGFRDVWQRWHITLVAWLRDYVFASMGGVHKGYFRAALHIMVTMLLMALWHGVTWTFLIFGGLHGTYLISETLLQRTPVRRMTLWRTPVGRGGLWFLTITLCLIAFVFYRASTVQQSLELLATMFGAAPWPLLARLSDHECIIAWTVIQALVVCHWMVRDVPLNVAVVRLSWVATSVGLALMLLALTMSSSDSQQFLYFQY
jgi:alginate O-acetyltransferase complex protein AlgI